MNKEKIHITYGLIIGVILVIANLILHMTHILEKPGMMWVAYLSNLPFLVGIIMGGMAYAKANDNYVTFGNIFWSCFRACMIVAIVMVVWSVIQLVFMPEVKAMAIQKAIEDMQKKGLPDSQIEMGIKWVKNFYTPFLIFGVIFGTLLFGSIFSLIAAAIPQKKGERPLWDLDKTQAG